MKKIIILFLTLFFAFSIQAQESLTKATEYLEIGNKLLKQKKYESAIINFSKAIELNPEEVEAYAYRGLAKYHLKKYKEAIEDYDIALVLKEGYAEVYNLRGIAKGELGDKKGSCEDWYQAYYHGFNDSYRLIKKFCEEKK